MINIKNFADEMPGRHYSWSKPEKFPDLILIGRY